jgi:hypothetical protein
MIPGIWAAAVLNVIEKLDDITTGYERCRGRSPGRLDFSVKQLPYTIGLKF